MTPLACGLDRLQGELNASLGYVLPTLTSMKTKISRIQTLSALGLDMRKSLIDGINSRFGSILKFQYENKELIIAAVSHPFFKLHWIENEEDRTWSRELFTSEVLSGQNLDYFEHVDEFSHQEDDFFEIYSDVSSSSSRRSSSDNLSIEILNYLSDSRKTLDILHQMPEIKRVFIKYNTTLSSSAPVERLFSQALIIFTPRRNRLCAMNFERALLYKHNKELKTSELRKALE